MVGDIHRLNVYRLAMRVAGVLGASAAIAAPACANMLSVPADFPTVNAAVSAAADGDTVIVADGDYSAADGGNILTAKSITIRSVNGPESTTIDCGGSGYFARLGGNAAIQGFTIKNCAASGGAVTTEGNAVISDCAFMNNNGEGVGVVNVNGGFAAISGCSFSGNSGLGAVAFGVSGGAISDCAFIDNRGNFGGAGAIYANTASVTVTNTAFTGNSSSATGSGGAIKWLNGSLTLAQSTFSFNRSEVGGGAIYLAASDTDTAVTATRCLFSDNSAPRGGVFYVSGSAGVNTINAVNCQFIDNEAADPDDTATNEGGVIYTAGPLATYNITNSSFCGNDVTPRTPGTGAISGTPGTTVNLLNTIMYGDLSSTEISTANPPSKVNVQASLIQQTPYGNVNTDPQYVDPTNGDLRIPASSPAAHAGISTGAPAIDFDSAPRGSRPSIGAFEPQIGFASAAAATHFVVTAPATATAGDAFNVTVTATDGAGNKDTAYAGKVHFTTTSSSFSLPEDAKLTNGAATFSLKLSTTGNQTVSATDTVNFGITGTSALINIVPGPASFFTVSSTNIVTAGDPFDITVNAHDVFGNPATNYNGTISFNSGDTHATLPPNSPLTNGTGTFTVTLATLGTQKIDVHDVTNAAITGGSSLITVNAGVAKIFKVVTPPNATAGTPYNFTVTALNTDGNTVTDYNGTVHFTSNDPRAVLPANATLANGTGTFTATAKTATQVTIKATDTVDPSLAGTGTTSVDSAALDHLTLTAPAIVTQGLAFPATVSGKDQFNNVVRNYNGTIHFTSTDPQATLPADRALTGGTAKVNAKLQSPGKTITATDTANPSLTATTPPIAFGFAATKFAIAGPATTVVGVSTTFTITAKDNKGNTATGYTGTVHLQTSDPTGLVSADTTLINGMGMFHGTFKTTGSQKVTAADTVNAAIKGATATTVIPAAATKFIITVPATVIAGTAFNATITAKDQFGNTATGYTGTVHFTSNDPLAVLPANVPLQNGSRQVVVKLKTHGSKTITATDTNKPAIKGTSPAVVVN